jgi:hypothetical protein
MKIRKKMLTNKACEDAQGLLVSMDDNEEQATIALTVKFPRRSKTLPMCGEKGA